MSTLTQNPFGPENANAAITVPPGNDKVRYGGQETFVKDCSASGNRDATVLDAAFFNNIIRALNYLVNHSGIQQINRGDVTLLYRAIAGVAQSSFIGAGSGLTTNGGVLSLALGTGQLVRLVP
jgi:hypothetical protein